jgi:UrcA family protein
MRNISTLVALGSALILSAPGFAQDAPFRVVKTQDLDLTSPDGLRILNRRIANAVEKVCPGVKISIILPTEVVKCRQLAALQAGQRMAAIVAHRREQLANR